MSSTQDKQYAQTWTALLNRYPVELLEQLNNLTLKWQSDLADHFYDRLLKDESAAQLISHEQVRTRLHASLRRWVGGVYGARAGDDLTGLVSLQRQVGMVHARIGVPVHLVLRAAYSLKDKFAELLHGKSGLPRLMQFELLQVMQGIMDLTMEIMSHAYATSHDRNSRAQEAYRLFAVVQNVATERQRQRAALLDWENRVMFELAMGAHATQLPRIGASDFGLWFRHKGAHAFQGTEEAQLIQASIERIDRELLPVVVKQAGESDVSERMGHLRELRDEAQAIAFRLDVLFRQTNELEAGRDALTRLLNRKYLPVVMNKEVAFARQHDMTFAVLVIDVDNFKYINDNYGHDAGDLVLQQLAVVLSNSCRAGDYIFRLGGEEFLMLLVDIGHDDAYKVADTVRQAVEHESFRLSNDLSLQVTVSVGLALYDGHPDYQLLMRRADDALYQAKHDGRNRVIAASV